ncbi:MAG TPA: GDP-mannose mannosyl hydrolase [Rhizomicrobium sp.]
MSTDFPLTPEQFCSIVRHTPLVSIDLVIQDGDGHVLVGHRTNEPAKGVYFVPGGIIRKDERLDEAFYRILLGETGLTIPRSEAEPLGVFEHFYPTNRYSEPGYGTHYIVNAYRLALTHRPKVRLDDQHRDIRWIRPDTLLAATDVHDNTKAYFR